MPKYTQVHISFWFPLYWCNFESLLRLLWLILLFQLIFKFPRGFCPPVYHCLNGQNDKKSILKSNITASTSTFSKKLAFNSLEVFHWLLYRNNVLKQHFIKSYYIFCGESLCRID